MKLEKYDNQVENYITATTTSVFSEKNRVESKYYLPKM